MPVGNWNLQWLNHNAQRSYPLTSAATKKDKTGTFSIPDDFIVGMSLCLSVDDVGAQIFDRQLFISRIVISSSGFGVNISTAEIAGGVAFAAPMFSVFVSKAEHVKNNTYALTQLGDSSGTITIGDLTGIENQPPGFFDFDPAATELEADVIRPAMFGIRSLQLLDSGAYSEKLYGNIVLVAGDNIKMVVEKILNPDTEQLETHVVINAVSNADLNEDCACEINETAPCITSINGITTTTGNFNISPNGCIALGEMINGLQIADICAEPCCGCSELDAVRDQINRFGDGITTLQNFVTRLGSEVSQMSIVVLGSRLGNSSCSTAG